MNQLGGFPLLTLIVFLPLFGALISLFVPSERRESRHSLAFLVAIANLFISLFLYMGWTDDPLVTTQFVDGPLLWMGGSGIHYHLGVDGINLYLVSLTAALAPLTMLASRPSTDRDGGSRNSTFWTLVLETGALGALTALDMALFSLFWLTALLAACFLIGENARHRSAMVHLWIAASVGGVLLLAVIVALSASQNSFDLSDLATAAIRRQTRTWLFWGVVSAFSVTGAVFPLHLPVARAFSQRSRSNHPTSPAAQVLVSSLVLDLAGYGMIRFCLSLVPPEVTRFSPVLVVLGTLGVFYGAVAALGQRDLPGTLAYWNVSQMGLTVAGIFSLQNLGLHGATTHLLARSLSVAALFLVSGTAAAPAPRESADAQSPRSGRAALAFAFLSAVGLPGTIGFLGQGLIGLGLIRWLWDGFTGTAIQRWLLMGLLGFGVLVGAWALLRAWRSAPPTGGKISRQAMLALPILFAILMLGLRPARSWDVVGPSVHRILQQVRSKAGETGSQAAVSAPQAEGRAETPYPIDKMSLASRDDTWIGTSWAGPGAATPALADRLSWSRTPAEPASYVGMGDR